MATRRERQNSRDTLSHRAVHLCKQTTHAGHHIVTIVTEMMFSREALRKHGDRHVGSCRGYSYTFPQLAQHRLADS
jgi:hypothetical protein